MATQPKGPSLPKSRGRSLFGQQASLHAPDPHVASNLNTFFPSEPFPPLKTSHSASSPPVPTSSVIHQHHPVYSPLLVHRRSPSSIAESYAHSDDNGVQLLGVHPRSESDYIKQTRLPALLVPTISSKLLVTDFPLDDDESEDPIPTDSTCNAVIDQAFRYLQKPDDDDDDEDVVHPEHPNEQENNSDSFDDEDESTSGNTYQLNPRTSQRNSKHDSKSSLDHADIMKLFGTKKISNRN